MKRPTPRGQNLVLFALTLLLLTLMVCITLSIGIKAKEKMELQTAADAAAYSQAVATARTYNSISVLNRALMSDMVAMSGVESLISWASYYRAVLNQVKGNYNFDISTIYTPIVIASCPCAPFNAACARFCTCATKATSDINQTISDIDREDQRVDRIFNSLDAQAGHEARGLQISSVSSRQQELFNRLLNQDLTSSSPKMAKAIADAANNGGMWQDMKATRYAATENGQEQGGTCGGTGAACRRRDAGHKNHFIWATMGTRGHPFLTNRDNGAMLIRAKLMTVLPTQDPIITLTNDGSGYFADSQNHSASPAGNGAAWADDHGSVNVMFLRNQTPCPPGVSPPGSPEALVRSDDAMQDNDRHEWSGGSDPGNRRLEHTMGTCTLCPGMWPPHMDYNYAVVTDPVNLWGQPKNYAVMERDYNTRPARQADPWNLLFKFRFSNTTETFDNTGLRLTDGTDISHAIALSAGLTYYHRVSHGYKEPPNFLNPFWRATLVGADIDEGATAIQQTLGSAPGPSGQLVQALNGVGYKAW